MKTAMQISYAGTAGENAAQCWSCEALTAVGAHFCSACGKVQPPTTSDYFSFFSLPRKLNLDNAALEKDFYRLSRKLHPDVYARATSREQEWSLEKSSQLNDAYRTLKDPIARTQYLLSLEGVQLEEQSKAATEKARATGEEKKQVVPPDLLEEVFDLNMQLQELKASGGKDPDAITQLQTARANFTARLDALSAELQKLWYVWDQTVEKNEPLQRTKVRDQMVDLLNRRSYIRNLVRDVQNALE